MRSFIWLGMLGCTGASVPPESVPEPAPPTQEARPVAQSLSAGINTTGLALYAQLAEGDDNVFFSPASIQVALGMTAAGARGETQTAMHTALSLPDDPHGELGGLIAGWNAQGDASPVQLSVANRLWVQQGLSLEPAFEQVTATQYAAGVGRLDFATKGDAERAPINAWVAEQTQDRIRDLLMPGTVTPSTRMVLTNAVYFKGDWATAFDEERTTTQPFTTLAGSQVDSELMYGRLDVRHYAGDGFQLAMVPYTGGTLDLLILLPEDAAQLADLEGALSADALDTWVGAASTQKVDLWLPRFETTLDYPLGKPLAALGMGVAFSPSADFSGMTTEARLAIDEVIHKAFVKLDETGTEAAAATAVVMRTTSMSTRPEPRVIMRCDHPFVFAIRDRATGSLLFLGRLADPTPA